MDVSCMSRQFGQRRRRRMQGRWTWRIRRQGRWISFHPGYFLCPRTHQSRFKKVGLRTPRHSHSDQWAIVAQIYGGNLKRLKAYRSRQSRFPIRMPRYGPRTEPECLFEELQAKCPKPSKKDRIRSHWILEETWKLVDHRAQLRRRGMLSLAASRQLNRQVKASLNSDRKQRAVTAAEEIEGHLDAGELNEAC